MAISTEMMRLGSVRRRRLPDSDGNYGFPEPAFGAALMSTIIAVLTLFPEE